MFKFLKFVSIEKYENQKALTQTWKDKFDKQIQAHQNTILVKDKAYRELKALYDDAIKKLEDMKENEKKGTAE
jgi:hypothetical protein